MNRSTVVDLSALTFLLSVVMSSCHPVFGADLAAATAQGTIDVAAFTDTA